jgi:hypothetical protein
MGCRLEAVRLDSADCSDATFRLCTLDGVLGAGANFDGARIEDSTAERADLSRASLRNAHLTETSFSRAVLREAVLDGAEGDGIEFRGADLRDATLIGVRFDEADFRGADLRGANLSNGRFRSSNFRGALLDGTNFTGANREGAWFDPGEGPHAEAPSKASDGAEASDGADASFDQTQIAALRELLGAIPEVFAMPSDASPELIGLLRRTSEILDRAEPSQEWKAWLEPLLATAQRNQSLDEILAALQSAVSKVRPADLRAWLEGIGFKTDEAE